MNPIPKTMSVPEAGRLYFDIGVNASYEAAKRGQIPCVTIGGRKRAIVAALDRMVGLNSPDAADQSA